MAESDKKPATLEELLVSSLAQTDALAKLLIEKGLMEAVRFFVTPYQYFIVGSGNTLVRRHRFTGEAERLGSSGWRRMTQGDS